MYRYDVNHINGSGDTFESLDNLPSLYDELSHANEYKEYEGRSVAVFNDDIQYMLAAFTHGLIILQKYEGDEEGIALHMLSVDKSKVLKYWEHLIKGEIEVLLKEPWQPGEGY